MAIGERIRFFRNKKGVTQKYLGQVVGFPERSADVRMAQYETGSRTPKADLTKTLAGFFEVSTDALTVPDIDLSLIHIFGALQRPLLRQYPLRVIGELRRQLLHVPHSRGQLL